MLFFSSIQNWPFMKRFETTSFSEFTEEQGCGDKKKVSINTILDFFTILDFLTILDAC